MKKVYKLGTRDSALALWQACFIRDLLQNYGIETELVHIKSEGEIDLVSPLYEIGVQGIFTKTLDAALLSGKIDIAVHSLKDVPTQVPEGIKLAAVPKRGPHLDLLIYKSTLPDDSKSRYTIATSSLRRRAQWLNRYPHHIPEPIRGNINSRLQKLQDHASWDATIMASAGIDRINLPVPNRVELDWMLPAPAQGALGVYVRNNDPEVSEYCSVLNDDATLQTTIAERQFLRTLMGGCTMPIAAHATIQNNCITIKGNVLTIDGNQRADICYTGKPDEPAQAVGERAAMQLMDSGGREILQALKSK